MKEALSEERFIHNCLVELCKNTGGRPVGSSNNKEIQDYIGGMFTSFGYNAEYQSFKCVDWERGGISLIVGNKKIDADISPYSLPITIKSEFQVVENIDHLKKVDVNNKVLVLCNELTKEAIMPKNFRFWNPEHHQEIIKTLEDKAPKAIITVSFSHDKSIPIIEDGDFNIPSAVVPGKFQDFFKQTTAKEISLTMNCKRNPSSGANVIARLNPGSKHRIVVCAHFDTKPNTPGALDNASGIVTMLLIAKLLMGSDIKIGVEFVAFNGEDYYSTPGQITYIDKYSHDFKNINIAINCDGIGFKKGPTGISPIGCPEELTQILQQKIIKHESLSMSDPWYQGDHMIFANQGIPSLAITSQEIFGLIDTVIHTPNDTIDLISINKIAETALFLEELINTPLSI